MVTDSKSSDEPLIAAAIDIGSNSIKMTVAQPDGSGGLTQLDWASEVVRLGQGLDASGRLDEQRIQAALETLRQFADRARERGAKTLVAVATEATRAAQNGQAFLDRVRAETGVDVRVVDGDAEAALTFRGLSATADLTGPVVIADIGGGSTEVIAAKDGTFNQATSIKLGSGRLTDKFVESDPPSHAELAKAEAESVRFFAPAATALHLEPGSGARLIIVGGTGEYMARLVPDGGARSMAAVREVLVALEQKTASELARQIEIPEARARVLPAGVAIVAAIADYIKPAQIEIAHSGVRAGLLLETFQKWLPQSAIAELEIVAKNSSLHDLDADAASIPGHNEAVASEPGFRATMKTLIAERWAVLWATIPVALEGTDVEGVHDVRVASRRLRAAMDIAAPVFSQRWYRSLHRTAKAITGALGDVRDRDVLLESLRADRDGAALPERPGIDRLIDRIERERVAARIDMEAFLRDLMEGPVGAEVERRFGPMPVSKDPMSRSSGVGS